MKRRDFKIEKDDVKQEKKKLYKKLKNVVVVAVRSNLTLHIQPSSLPLSTAVACLAQVAM